MEDGIFALVAEVAPEDPFNTFRTHSCNDNIPGDKLYTTNNEIARNYRQN